MRYAFAILVYDVKGRLTDINKKFEEYFRIKPKEIIGIGYNVWKDFTANDLKTNESGKTEVHLYNDDGDRIIEVREETIVNIFSCIDKLCVCRDVTIKCTFQC